MRACVRMGCVELHCHSAFSFLDGASLPDELVAAALELGHDPLALTDHNSVSGSMEFAVSARALGLRPIHGAELDLDDGRHLTLLVQDARGWSNLCRILTYAHAHTREKPGPPAGRLERRRPERGSRMTRRPPNETSQDGEWAARPRPSRRLAREPYVPLTDILDHAEGLVCLS